jgi:hypothetical protein
MCAGQKEERRRRRGGGGSDSKLQVDITIYMYIHIYIYTHDGILHHLQLNACRLQKAVRLTVENRKKSVSADEKHANE